MKCCPKIQRKRVKGCNRWPSFLFKSFAVGDNGNTTQPQGTNKPQPQPVPAFIFGLVTAFRTRANIGHLQGHKQKIFVIMCIELDYNGSGCNMAKAIANALKVNEKNVNVVVMPPFDNIPFRCDWRVVNSCADLVAYVNGKLLQLNIV